MNTKDTDAIAALIAQNTHLAQCCLDIEYKLLDGKGFIEELADYLAADACSTSSTRCKSCFDRNAFVARCYGEPAARSE